MAKLIELRMVAEDFTLLDYMPYKELQWTRRYYECGEFSAQVAVKYYDSRAKYLWTKDRAEFAVIQSIEYVNTKKDGIFVQISGFFIEKILDDKIIYPAFRQYGTPSIIAQAVVNQYKDDIPKLQVLQETEVAGERAAFDDLGSEMGKALFELLKTQEQSYKIVYDPESDVLNFSVWKGLDKTQGQSINPYLVFSTRYGTISNVVSTEDISNYKNYAVVKGDIRYTIKAEVLDEKTGKYVEKNVPIEYTKYVTIDKSNGGYRKEILVDAGSGDEEFETEGIYQKGLEKLQKYEIIKSVEFEPYVANDGGSLKYLEDYDLGDLADIVISELNLVYTARITEIREVISHNQLQLTIVVGDKKPTTYERMLL